MLVEALKYLVGFGAAGSIDADNDRVRLLPPGVNPCSMEAYSQNRYRERFRFHTGSITDYAQYSNELSASLGMNPISTVDSDDCTAVCIFNHTDEQNGLPGQCDNTAKCKLVPLPMYKALMNIGQNDYMQLSQRELIDWMRDWHDHVIESARFIQTMESVTVDTLANVNAVERDFSSEMTAMEAMSVKGKDGGKLPSDIKVKFIPYDGFSERECTLGLSFHVDADRKKMTFMLRVRQYEPIKIAIAKEFCEILGDKLEFETLVGTISPS